MVKMRKAGWDSDVSGLPIDRGYAWVIAFSCLFCNLLSLGVQRAYGILFVEFLRMFQMSAGVTAVILSAQSAVTSIAALLTQTVVLSFLSVRQTVVIGGFLGGLGLILSYFAESIYMLYFTISVLVGLSLAMILGPAVVIVGMYFEKRRSLASAIATLGGNLGSTIMPIFAQELIDEYGGRSALLLLGGTCLNVMVGGLLLRPLHLNKRRRYKTESRPEGTFSGGEATATIAKDFNNHQDEVEQSDKLLPQRKTQRQLSLPVNSTDLPSGELSVIGSLTSLDIVMLPQTITPRVVDEPSDDDENYQADPQDTGNVDQSANGRQRTPSRATNGHLTTGKERNLLSKVLALFDFGLFRNPRFLVVLMSFSFGIVPAAHFGTYLPAMTVDKGFTGDDAALLLTIFGGVGMVARLFFGFFADLNIIPRPLLTALLMAACSVAGLFTPLYTSFTSLIIFCVVYGLFGPVFFSIFPVVIIDILGLKSLSTTLGFVQLFQGVVVAAVHPIIGHLRDVTGSYHASFHLMSSCGLFSAFVMIVTSLVSKTQARCARSRPHEPLEGQKSSKL